MTHVVAFAGNDPRAEKSSRALHAKARTAAAMGNATHKAVRPGSCQAVRSRFVTRARAWPRSARHVAVVGARELPRRRQRREHIGAPPLLLVADAQEDILEVRAADAHAHGQRLQGFEARGDGRVGGQREL